MLKKITFSILLVFNLMLCNKLYAQNLIFKTDLGFSITNEYPNSGNVYNSHNNKLSANLTGGKLLGKNMIVGIGFAYGRFVTKLNDEFYFNQGDPNTMPEYFGYYTRTNILEKTFAPIIYLEHFINIDEKLALSFGLYSKYQFGTSKSKSKNKVYPVFPGSSEIEESIQNRRNLNYQYILKDGRSQKIALAIQPNIRYKFFKNAGLEMTFGRLIFSKELNNTSYLDEERKTSRFALEFTPKNWSIGFFYMI